MIDKIFEKLICKYYSNILIRKIESTIKCFYDLDTHVIYDKDDHYYTIFAKPKHYNVYTKIYAFNKFDDSFDLLIIIKDVKDRIIDIIDDLYKNNKWKKSYEKGDYKW